jgi:mycothiol system anti-sigma-R factor
MNCAEFDARVNPYVDGELEATDMTAADAHLVQCPECQSRVERERQFRQLLRRQPRESAPPELRALLRTRIRRSARIVAIRPWLVGTAAAAAVVLVVALLPEFRPASSLVSDLVSKHITYAQIEQPAEFASQDPRAVEAWFRERAGLRVTVADYSPSGIRLVGGRLAEADDHKAAYVLYEKGHTLMSVFMVPASAAEVALKGSRVSYRGHDYLTLERKGYNTVAWTDGKAMFGLVSMLSYDALLECADRLRLDRAQRSGA